MSIVVWNYRNVWKLTRMRKQCIPGLPFPPWRPDNEARVTYSAQSSDEVVPTHFCKCCYAALQQVIPAKRKSHTYNHGLAIIDWQLHTKSTYIVRVFIYLWYAWNIVHRTLKVIRQQVSHYAILVLKVDAGKEYQDTVQNSFNFSTITLPSIGYWMSKGFSYTQEVTHGKVSHLW